MSDSIAVINAGSSSIKFSLFAERGSELELKARGQIEGIYTAPRFAARDGAGTLLAEKSWGDGVKLIYQQSGLLGVSGIPSDMRALEASAEPDAKRAIDLFVYRIGRELGSLVAALGGLDTLVFTGGIGEHAFAIRERVCRDAVWVGVELDTVANGKSGPRISTASSRVAA